MDKNNYLWILSPQWTLQSWLIFTKVMTCIRPCTGNLAFKTTKTMPGLVEANVLNKHIRE